MTIPDCNYPACEAWIHRGGHPGYTIIYLPVGCKVELCISIGPVITGRLPGKMIQADKKL